MPQVNIKKRGDKYQYYFEVASVDGKRKRKTKDGFKTKREALEAGTRALAEYNSTGIVLEEKKISFADYLNNDWMNRYCKVNLKPSTIESYRKIIKNQIAPEIGNYYLNALNSAVLQDFINRKFNEGLSRNSLAKMSETVSGSFCFSILTDKNEVYLVKGSNPLAIYDCDGYYVYASTSDILDKTLKKMRIKKKEKVEIKSGEILKISADGTIERSTFNNDDYDYPYYPYRGKYFDYGFDDDENELDALIMYAGYFGIDETDIMILIDLGYDAMEIEELMYDPVMLKEIVGECREMMACEIGG